jgi:3,4-dihydroxy 2-butanone 4-phosphate synthase/GTP cyclohydrolase II
MDQFTIKKMVSARIPTPDGEFRLSLYTNNGDEKEHLALVMGDVDGKEDVLVRIHSECFTGDVLGSSRCDCGEQLRLALAMIAQEGQGVLIYLRQEGRGIGLMDKLKAYNLQDEGFDTVEANLLLGHQPDERDFTIATRILTDMGVGSVRLLTNNPVKIETLERLGIQVLQRVRVKSTITPENAKYLRTKVNRMNHLLNLKPLSIEIVEQENGSN